MGFDYFDRVYCISLPFEDRREKIAAEFERVGIKDVQYVYAEPPAEGFHMSNMRRAPRGEFGCNLSHIKAAMHALADGAERPLFFEDDVVFVPDARERISAAVSEGLMDWDDLWDVLYLGGHPRSQCHRITNNLVRVNTFSFAESYALNRHSLVRWLDFWCDNIGQKDAMVDLQLGRFAAYYVGYCVYPLITHQPPGFSQIANKEDNKDNCLKKGWRTNLCTTENLCDECAASAIKSA